MAKYEIYDYDVWGNPKDGYEVNDVYSTGIEIEIPDEATDEQIIKQLKNVGFLRKGLHARSFSIDGEPEYSLYVESNARRLGGLCPICELRNINQPEFITGGQDDAR